MYQETKLTQLKQSEKVLHNTNNNKQNKTKA